MSSPCNNLGKDSIGKLLFKLATPAIICFIIFYKKTLSVLDKEDNKSTNKKPIRN